MPDEKPYNPNALWTSKQKKFNYEPKPRIVPVGKRVEVQKKEAVPEVRDSSLKTSPIRNSGSGSGGGRKILFVALGVVALIAIGFGIYFFLFRATSAPVAQITFMEPDRVAVGDPFPFAINYANNSGVVFKGATLTLTLPSGVSFAGQSANQQVMQWSLGDLDSGSSGNQSTTLIVTGSPNVVANLAAALTYNPSASGNAQAETDAKANVVVGSPAIGLVITAPGSVASGQNFTMTVSYVNNTSDALGDVRIGLQVPPVFTFVGSSTSTDSAANNEWDIGALAPGASGNFTVTGAIVGPADSPYAITAAVSANFSNQRYAIATQTANLVTAHSPLVFGIALNQSQNYVAKLGDSLDYQIAYSNDSNVTLQNAVITAKLTGAMFDFSTLQSQGSLNSISNTVTWNGANTPALQNLAPGQSGVVDITVRTANSFPIRLLSDKDYLLKIQGQMISPTVPSGVAASTTVALANLTNKVGGQVTFAAVGFAKETTTGAPKNTGPYPPKANQPTQYTIHWSVTNYSTDIANVTVSAYLQSGTTCTGSAWSNASGTLPVCDPTTGLVTWTVPAIPATTGVISAPAEAIFQVVNTPAVNQVGDNVTLLGASSFTATDEFVSSTVSESAPAIDTSLPQDPIRVSGTRQVQN